MGSCSTQQYCDQSSMVWIWFGNATLCCCRTGTRKNDDLLTTIVAFGSSFWTAFPSFQRAPNAWFHALYVAVCSMYGSSRTLLE